METEQNRDETEQQTGDESPEEFAEQVEEDPSTATSGEDELEQVRGG